MFCCLNRRWSDNYGTMVKVTCNFLHVCTITIHLFSPYIIQHGICIKIYSTPGQDIGSFHYGINFSTGTDHIYSRLSSSRSSASPLLNSRMAAVSPLTFKAPLVNETPSSSKSSPVSSEYAYLQVPDQNIILM